MKLRNKVLVTFIATASVLVAVLFFLLHWSFERGAVMFKQKEDQEQLPRLAVQLANYYQHEGSWQRFSNDSQFWAEWVRNQGFGLHAEQASSFGPPGEPFDDGPPLQGPPPLVVGWPMGRPGPGQAFLPPHAPAENTESSGSQDPLRQSARMGIKPFFLLDSDHRALVGRYNQHGLTFPIEIDENGIQKIVGYIGLPPPPSEIDGFWQRPSAARQQNLLVMFAFGALLASVIAAIPLSARIVRRILTLHDHVATLTQGHYENRLTLNGNDELTGLAQHLNQLAQALTESQRQRRQFTADISHELRTPVANLQANIEAMQDEVLPLSQEALAQLHEQTQRLSNLIDDLYQLALADTDALRYHMSECEIRNLLEELVSALQAQFQRKSLSLTLSFSAELNYWVWGDKDRLKQVFSNLLENSRRYTNSPGKVDVSVAVNNDHIYVTVSDSPPGVDKALYSKLTDRLFRVDDARNRKDGGAGLGLNLCAAIVKAHHGKMTFKESAMGGLAVTVELPMIMSEQA